MSYTTVMFGDPVRRGVEQSCNVDVDRNAEAEREMNRPVGVFEGVCSPKEVPARVTSPSRDVLEPPFDRDPPTDGGGVGARRRSLGPQRGSVGDERVAEVPHTGGLPSHCIAHAVEP